MPDPGSEFNLLTQTTSISRLLLSSEDSASIRDLLTLPIKSSTVEIVSSLNELKGLPLQNGKIVFLNTNFGGSFKCITGDRSALVGLDPSGYIVVAPTEDLTGASGVWVRSDISGVTPQMFDAKGDTIIDSNYNIISGTDDTLALQAWLDVSPLFGPKLLPSGYYSFTNLVLPDWEVTDVAWSFDGPCNIIGLKNQSFLVQLPSCSPGYAIKHPNVGSTSSSRGQHFGVSIKGTTLIGPGDITKALSGWGIENTRMLEFEDNDVFGYPAGVGLHLYAHNDGGMFGATIRRNQFGRQRYINLTGVTSTSPAYLERTACEYAIRSDGPYDSTGKCNDLYIYENRIENMLLGGILIKGHGTKTTSGSTYNINTFNNVTVLQEAKKMEEGYFSAVADSTHMTLRVDSGSYTSMGTDGLVGKVCSVLDSGNLLVESRGIVAWNDTTREITLDSAFTVTPTAGVTKYRIGYGRTSWAVATNNQFKTGNASFNPKTLYHGIFYDTPEGSARFNDYFEEGYCYVVVATDASTDVAIEGIVVVSEGYAFFRIDSGKWSPRKGYWTQARGSQTVYSETILSGHIWVGDVQNYNNSTGFISTRPNSTNTTLSVGSVVRMSGNGLFLVNSVDWDNPTYGNYRHVVIAGRGVKQTWANGEDTTYITTGGTKVLIDLDASGGAITPNMVIVPMLGNKAKAVTTATLGGNSIPVIGSPKESVTGSGVVLVNCWIRGPAT